MPAPDGPSAKPPSRAMRIDMMRRLDHWVGLPVCFMMGLLANLLRRIHPRPPRVATGTRPIAVFKFLGMGSILQATPLLRAIRNRYPQSQLVLVTFEANAALARRLNICTDIRVIRTGSLFRFGCDVIAELRWLRRNRVEAVVDLEFFSKFSTLLACFTGAHVRVGFHLNDFWRYSLITHPIYFNYFRHIGDIYREAARQLDAPIDHPALSRIERDGATRPRVQQWLQQHGWTPGRPLIGVNVNAGEMSPERRWPIDSFAEVIGTLLGRHENACIVLTGSPAERGYVLSVVECLPPSIVGRVMLTAGEWSFDEFIAGLELFDCFLTNDSGPMHMAAAQGVRTISLWGPGRPEFYAPKVGRNRTIYTDYPCSPCLYMFTTFEGMWCNHEGWCMQSITPAMVVPAVEDMLAKVE